MFLRAIVPPILVFFVHIELYLVKHPFLFKKFTKNKTAVSIRSLSTFHEYCSATFFYFLRIIC